MHDLMWCKRNELASLVDDAIRTNQHAERRGDAKSRRLYSGMKSPRRQLLLLEENVSQLRYRTYC